MKLEINIDEKKLVDNIINELKKQRQIGSEQSLIVVYNAESKDVLYTVSEVAELIKSSNDYVYNLIKAGLLPALKLGSLKVTRQDLLVFLDKYKGYDLSKPFDIQSLK